MHIWFCRLIQFGANHGITCGVSEWGTMSSSNPSLESVIYGSHLGTFANNGVELFSPWNWSIGMWETLHLFSRNAKKYSVSSTSSLENTVSAYSSVNENSDSLTVMLVNRDQGASRTVTINLSNFNVANGNYQTLRLSSLPATETFVSHMQNALVQSTVAVNSNSLTITVPTLSTTAILLVKAPSVTYVSLTNRATGILMDGLWGGDGSTAGQWGSSGSLAQQWVIETTGSYVKIKNRASGLYLDGNGGTSNPSNVYQKNSSTSNNQQWSQEAAGSYVKFKNRATGLYIDGLGSNQNNAVLGQWSTSSSYNQQWGISNLSSAASVSTVASTQIAAGVVSTKETKFQIQLNPNPFKSSFTLNIPDPKDIKSIAIFDMSGRRVKKIEHSAISNTMTMGANLKPGLYLVQINGKNGSQSFKVVKE